MSTEPAAALRCPFCGGGNVRVVRFTWRGGVAAAKMFHLRRCRMCDLTFNAKTGKRAGRALTLFAGATLLIVAGAAVVVFLYLSGRI